VGINAYTGIDSLRKLARSRADAEAVARLLSDRGYTVTRLLDADREELLAKFVVFVNTLLVPAPVAASDHQEHPVECDVVLYFSGHGLSSQGHNYVVPTDGNSNGTMAFFCFCFFLCCLRARGDCLW
jgi:hypothetical protein